jgi:endonuclease/exonuclease/phosphatase family metal-dependent hydrolase
MISVYSRSVIALIALLALGFSFAACGDDNRSGTYTIFTYNVDGFDRGWNGPTGSRPLRTSQDGLEHDRIAEIIKTNQVDVLGLNEILQGQNIASPRRTHQDAADFKAALEEVGWPMPHYAHSSVSDGWNNNAYFSRFPVSNAGEIGRGSHLPNWNGARTVYRYRVTFPGDNHVWFYGVHLKSGQASTDVEIRRREATGLGNFIRENHNTETELIVVYGDMNTMNTLDWPSTMGPSNDDGTRDRPSGQAGSGFSLSRIPTGVPGLSIVCLLEHRISGIPAARHFTSLVRAYIYPDTTINTFEESTPLDHIILSPTLYRDHYVPYSVRLVGPGYGRQGSRTNPNGNYNPSDHHGVLAQIRF